MDNDSLAPTTDVVKIRPLKWSDAEEIGALERGDQTELAALLIRELRCTYGDLISVDRAIYGYSGGVYTALEMSDLGRRVMAFAGKAIGEGEHPHALSVGHGTVTGTISLACLTLDDPTFFDSPTAGIAFRNGFVTVDSDGLHLVDHSASHRARHAYSFDFEESSTPDQFLKFLGELFAVDDDACEKIALVQEFIGAALMRMATTYQRAILMLGGGDNGKSTFAEIVKAVMPPGSVTALPPSLINDQYARPRLRESLLNVDPDIPDDAIGNALKAAVTGDRVQGRNPGQAAIDFEPVCAHLYGANKLPSTLDPSKGFFRRWIVVPFNCNFETDPSRKVDRHIGRRIATNEAHAIVRWALDGAARLVRNGSYTVPASHRLMLDRWRGGQDPISLFLEQRTTRSKKGTAAAVLLAAFEEWAEPFGVVMTGKEFYAALASRGLKGTRQSGHARYLVGLIGTDGASAAGETE